jgi:hypothetical protein
MDQYYRVVFQGIVHEGLDPVIVRQRAAQRLRATPEQIDSIFSGRKIILKQGLTVEQGQAYFRALEQVGMTITLERMEIRKDTLANRFAPTAPGPQKRSSIKQIQVQTIQNTPPSKGSGVSQFERTHINLARAEALLNGSLTPGSTVPTERQDVASAQINRVTPPQKNLDKVHSELAALEAYLGAHSVPRTPRDPPPPQNTTAAAARQILNGAADHGAAASLGRPDEAPVIFTTIINCPHCGRQHLMEGHLTLEIVAHARRLGETG